MAAASKADLPVSPAHSHAVRFGQAPGLVGQIGEVNFNFLELSGKLIADETKERRKVVKVAGIRRAECRLMALSGSGEPVGL
jgi:hypothetical protein